MNTTTYSGPTDRPEQSGSTPGTGHNDALLRALIETTPGLLYVKDLHGRMLMANTAALALIGKPWAAVEGRTDCEILDDPAQGDAIMENDRQVLRAGVTQEIEEWVGTENEAPRVWLSTKTPMRDAAGHIIGLVGLSVDITARKCMERELRKLHETAEARVAQRTRERDRAWRLSQDLLLVSDFTGATEAVNPAWTAILGWTEAELLGQRRRELIHPDDHARTVAEVARVAEGHSTFDFENRYRHRDGSYRSVSWRASSDGSRIYGTGRDITADKARDAALAQVEEQLRQSHKMEAIGQLTGGIAHDFNNMLQGINGSLEMMRRRIAQGRTEEAAAFVAEAHKVVARAATLTHRLLAFARRQALAPRPIDPCELVRSMAELIQRAAGPQTIVDLDLCQDGGSVLCDQNQLESALLNLAINACDAMPQGGRLTVGVARVQLGDAELAGHEPVRPGAYLEIAVTDTGHGMSPEVLARAFEAFFTTRPPGHGTGLGLSQLYGFVRQSGGLVRLRSAPGQGAAVRMLLPLHEATPGSPQAVATPLAPAVSAARGVVLVVEDEPGIRAAVVEIVRELGYDALEAADGPSGLRIVQSSERIDLLITDIGLPGLNGRRLADAAQARHPGLPVLLITGYAGSALDGWELAPGMEVIAKPFPLALLTERIRRLVTRPS